METKDLLYYNGFGGFSKDGKEYILKTSEKYTPLPWSHLIANEKFGTIVTSSGGGYVWSGNSRENKITAWCNNQVTDEQSEKIIIKNLKTEKEFNALPRDNLNEFEVHYGFGYAKFLRDAEQMSSELLIYVPLDRNEKLCVLEIENKKDEAIDLEISYTLNPVLGVCKDFTAKHLKFENIKNGAIIQNNFRDIYQNEKVVVEIIEAENNVEKNFDDAKNLCLSTTLKVLEGQKKKIIVRVSIEERREFPEIKNDLVKVNNFWHDMLGKIKIKSPVESFNLLMNGWLGYQTIVSRLWGRTSFYQAGGAYGFRDQLQDTLMLLNIDPSITRKQILYHAEHQFKEGDVMHWWHPEKNNGIRTRFSDDLLWLPFLVCKYIEVTNDYEILDEMCGYVEAPELLEQQDEIYMEVGLSDFKDDLYTHAKKAIEKRLCFGEHGIPEMGSGDWNDGMNKIKGESVWLGFFLYDILMKFSKICEHRDDSDAQKKYLEEAEKLKKNLNENAWDGKWFKRAFFEDGVAIGSETSSECKIDGISQSFSAISGAVSKERCIEAMKSLDKNLVDRENMLIKLLTPAFSKLEKNPGYIKAYVPGVRENGGQYTHGAIWSVIANAILQNGEKAVEYFRILNPIEHARTIDAALKYKVEPYVVAADVYSNPNMIGRGGWTWYTGSSSWLYVAGLEYILGIKRKGDYLEISPCFSKEWESCIVEYKYCDATYTINIYNPDKKEVGWQKIYLNNEACESNMIKLEKNGEYKIDFII